MTRALMFQGTGSDVGKTMLVAGLCRALRQRGHNVVPFKPQNMSNNAAVAGMDETGLSGEISRAQWLQAYACGVAPSVHMNPVLLKPQSETGSQIIVHGRWRGNATARDYHEWRPKLLRAVLTSYRHVSNRADIVLVEGAGSAAEVNLRDGDIANMGFATAAGVPVVLVGDIDRGGVIASLVGTHAVLAEADRDCIVGYIINKFRGDISLFDPAIGVISRHTNWKSFGILPWQPSARKLPAEDSVALEQLSAGTGSGGAVIAVPVLPRIANFDDLDPLRNEPGIDLVLVREGEAIPDEARMVVLPGSKSTIADLRAMREYGWDHQIQALAEAGRSIVGVCGGFQMLGKSISDPHGVEGKPDRVPGLGLLDVETELALEKTVENREAVSSDGHRLSGYEIHMGRTTGADCARPMVWIDGRADGAVSSGGNIMGCYLHGLFANDEFRASMLERIGATRPSARFSGQVDSALDTLAAAIERHLDVDALLAVSARARTSPPPDWQSEAD